MLIYNYDRETNEFLGSREARKSPLEDNVWLIPASSTTIAPPSEKDGFVRCFINGSWTQVEDNRGKIIYNTDTKEPVTVDSLGEIGEGFTAEEPVSEFSVFKDGKWVIDENLVLLKQKSDVMNAIQNKFDTVSKTFGFDSINTAILWMTSKNERRASKATALHDWADSVLDWAENEFALKEAGTPTYTDVESFIEAIPNFTFSE